MFGLAVRPVNLLEFPSSFCQTFHRLRNFLVGGLALQLLFRFQEGRLRSGDR